MRASQRCRRESLAASTIPSRLSRIGRMPANPRIIEQRHFNPCHLMSRRGGTFRIGSGKRMAEAVSAGIGMSLDDRYLARHGSVSLFAAAPLRGGIENGSGRCSA